MKIIQLLLFLSGTACIKVKQEFPELKTRKDQRIPIAKQVNMVMDKPGTDHRYWV
jgi:hypothetical protein